jgi:hypothetical protein
MEWVKTALLQLIQSLEQARAEARALDESFQKARVASQQADVRVRELEEAGTALRLLLPDDQQEDYQL